MKEEITLMLKQKFHTSDEACPTLGPGIHISGFCGNYCICCMYMYWDSLVVVELGGRQPDQD